MAWALGAAALIFLISGLPICYYGARYGVDMDLLTRGSGFGYLGSTITSAVYASFTFILFAIEAVMFSVWRWSQLNGIERGRGSSPAAARVAVSSGSLELPCAVCHV